jgi:hypothetical protein
VDLDLATAACVPHRRRRQPSHGELGHVALTIDAQHARVPASDPHGACPVEHVRDREHPPVPGRHRGRDLVREPARVDADPQRRGSRPAASHQQQREQEERASHGGGAVVVERTTSVG